MRTLLLLTALVAPLAAQDRPMTPSSSRLAATYRLLEALHRQDLPVVMSLVAPDARWDRGDGSGIAGRDALAAALRQFLRTWPDAALTSLRMEAVEPDAVVASWVMESASRGVRVVGADLLHFNDAGLIARDDARIDTGSLAAQLGGQAAALPNEAAIRDLAVRYTTAWCSQNPASVAAFFSPDGSLKVNSGAPAVGRAAITESARGFMTAFPDLVVQMDNLLIHGDRAVYQWTLIGTNSGPGGTGRKVRVSGYEIWRFGADGLIAESLGHFDSGAYQRQIDGTGRRD